MRRAEPIQIDWTPDRTSPVPVYRQIVQYICRKIEEGTWVVGTRLPPQRQMAEQFCVNRSTIASAMDELTSYGIVAGCGGAGTQIVSNTWSVRLGMAPDWKKFLTSGFFRANNRTIQEINRLEFVPGMVRLGTGELDPKLFPTALWKETIGKLREEVTSLGYLEPLGMMRLRQALSEHLKGMGIDVPPSGILVTSGSLQGLQLISSCLLQPGDTVFTEAPTYLKSLQVFQSAGMRLLGVPMDESGLQVKKLAGDVLSERMRNASILYTIPTNQNPTGITMTAERRKELMHFCTENRIPVIEDGAYQELCFDIKMPHPLKSMDTAGNVIYLGSASKTLAPGLRIGWVAAPEAIVQRLGDVKMQMDYGASSLSQLAFAEFLESGAYARYLEILKKELKNRCEHALIVLEREYRDLAVWRVPTGGFYIWLTLKKKVSMEQLFREAANEKILLNPGDMYDFAPNHALRLSYAYEDCQTWETAAVKLAQIIRKLAE